jgi:glutamate-5-semialdehyde dehydrogenase
VLLEPVAEASQGRSLSLSRCGARRASLPVASIRTEVTLREDIEHEARAANEAGPGLTDDGVSQALRRAGALARVRRGVVLEANALDVKAATGRLDEGTLDRLRLDDVRVEGLARQLEAMAEIEPLAREVDAWTLPNGLRVSERRIPIGTVGANFEARPNVALDVAGQLLKSLNTAVLRTGGAALGTVTVLVDEILRPALADTGIPPGAVGLVRSPDREGARLLVSLPALVPLVILRGSGGTTAALARLAAENGVRTLAHAEGGGVLYVHGSASREKALALAEASLDRMGVCNRLNLALVDREAADVVPELLELFSRKGLEVRGTVEGAVPLDRPLGHEWASDPERVTTITIALVDDLGEAVRVANQETSGLAAGIVAEDEEAANRFLEGYRGTAAFWHATTRFTDGFELTGAPETGINVDWAPGPRGPVTYRDLWLRQYRVVGDGTQTR